MNQSCIIKCRLQAYSNYALFESNSNLSHGAVEFLILRNPEPAGQLNSYLRFLKIRNYGLPNQPFSIQFFNLRNPPTGLSSLYVETRTVHLKHRNMQRLYLAIWRLHHTMLCALNVVGCALVTRTNRSRFERSCMGARSFEIGRMVGTSHGPLFASSWDQRPVAELTVVIDCVRS